MIYRKIKRKNVYIEVQKDVKSTSLKCMILWKQLDIFSMITSWKPRTLNKIKTTEYVSDCCNDESIQFRQVENTSELSVAKAKVTILEEDAKHESDLVEVIEDATTVKTKRA